MGGGGGSLHGGARFAVWVRKSFWREGQGFCQVKRGGTGKDKYKRIKKKKKMKPRLEKNKDIHREKRGKRELSEASNTGGPPCIIRFEGKGLQISKKKGGKGCMTEGELFSTCGGKWFEFKGIRANKKKKSK